MIKYFSDKLRRGVIKLENRYDSYVWDYALQMWRPCPGAAAAVRNKCEYDEITSEETERIQGTWQ